MCSKVFKPAVDCMKSPLDPPDKKIIIWLKRIGVVGFLFFLLKGIAWLAFGYFVFG